MMTLRRFVIAFSFLALISTESAPAQQTQTTTLLFNLITQQDYPFNVQVFYPWGKEVEKVTGGRVKVNFTATPVVPPAGQYEGVVNDTVDGAEMYDGLIVNKLPLEQLALLPLGTTTGAATSVALWRTYQKYFQKSNEFQDVQLLALICYGPGQIFGLKKPLNAPADFDGIKLWSIPGASANVVRELKSGVVSTPAVDMTQLVAGGVVDGFVGIMANDAQTNGVLNYARYETVVPGGITSSSFSIFVNKAKWQSIQERDRNAILAISGEAFARRLSAIDQQEKKVVLGATGHLTQMNASPALMTAIRSAAAPLDAAWIKTADSLGVDGKAALEYFRQQAQQNAR